MRSYLASLEHTEAMGERLDDPKKFAWYSMSVLGLVPHSDYFRHVTANSVVEIYDLTGHQIWRNFEFFKFCSYTLEEVFCLEWFSRYSRNEKISESCLACVGDLLKNSTLEFVHPDFGPHLVEETCSIDKLIIEMNFDMVARLNNRNGIVSAFSVVSSATLIGKSLEAQKLEPSLKLVPSSLIS
jgi:hypothetical protein